ncbi:hypothetical protein SEVIR_3G330000v4 [Setaria viridis]|uniref:Uncharacterized protein n=1 Tax=Setaria viridis TaxID=4556 RepID=A0A4U6VI29_SETVI|nr:hypothetical protein SEVIR_3G330000v2 [Setaria viridis]
MSGLRAEEPCRYAAAPPSLVCRPSSRAPFSCRCHCRSLMLFPITPPPMCTFHHLASATLLPLCVPMLLLPLRHITKHLARSNSLSRRNPSPCRLPCCRLPCRSHGLAMSLTCSATRARSEGQALAVLCHLEAVVVHRMDEAGKPSLELPPQALFSLLPCKACRRFLSGHLPEHLASARTQPLASLPHSNPHARMATKDPNHETRNTIRSI